MKARMAMKSMEVQ
jgi:chromosome segregation ATPase